MKISDAHPAATRKFFCIDYWLRMKQFPHRFLFAFCSCKEIYAQSKCKGWHWGAQPELLGERTHRRLVAGTAFNRLWIFVFCGLRHVVSASGKSLLGWLLFFAFLVAGFVCRPQCFGGRSA
jgi:hypothetical protein